ncbi:ribonuclease H-like domain-containing protein [bacterium]|nr:ribonuclease H-like domain-containing protein [bacterium]
MKFFLLDLDYIIDSLGKTKARLFGRDEKGKLVEKFIDFSPYFFVLPQKGKEKQAIKDIERLLSQKKKKVEKIEITKRKLNGEEKNFIKITCFRPPDTSNIRDIVKKLEKKRGGKGEVLEEYQYSLSFSDSFLLENKIYEPGWVEEREGKIFPLDFEKEPSLKVIAFDIEINIEKGREKIIMISYFGEDFKKVVTYQKAKYPNFVKIVKNEKELLEDFKETIKQKDPDIILTYNGDAFDFPMIRERAKEYKLKIDIGRANDEFKFLRRGRASAASVSGRVHIDLFPFINNILSPNLETEVLTLNAVSAELLGDKKIEMDFQELLEAWRKKKDLQKLALYCLKDSELTFRLYNLLSSQIFELSKISGQLLFNVARMTYSQLVESFLTKKAHALGEIIPNQPKFDEILKRKQFTFTGGYVKEPIGGVHENIAVVDFRSLYPSIIATFNISPEVLNCSCCKNNGFRVPETEFWFCKKKKGFVASVIRELLEERWEIKKKMKKEEKGSRKYYLLDTRQHVIKIIANATYGYFGFSASKWYCKECAQSAAAWGRKLIKEVIGKANRDFVVVYGDTDSAFLKPKEGKEKNFKEDIKKFLEKINRTLPGVIELDLQGFYKRGIFIPRGLIKGTAKKRYALLDEKGNLLIRGLETVRKDWCNLAKELQRKVLEFVLRKEDIKGAIKYTREIISKIKSKKILLKDLVIYEQLTKPIEEYKSLSPHLACAKKMKEKGEEVEPGTIIMFVISKKGEKISDRAIPYEWAKISDIDINYYIYHQILPAALRILSVFDIKEQDLIR